MNKQRMNLEMEWDGYPLVAEETRMNEWMEIDVWIDELEREQVFQKCWLYAPSFRFFFTLIGGPFNFIFFAIGPTYVN